MSANISKETTNDVVKDDISEAVINYLKMDTSGAIFLDGVWGSGKTYYVKNHLRPQLKDKDFELIIVSLYGLTDKKEILNKILFEVLNLLSGEKTQKYKVINFLKNIYDVLPGLKKTVDVDKLLVGSGSSLLKRLPTENLLICFDDLERISKTVNVKDFLGIVNDLVENQGIKALIIANEAELKTIGKDGKTTSGIPFKEKTIEKTLFYEPNMPLILNDLIEKYQDDKLFENYLTENKEFILKTLSPQLENEQDNEVLVKDLSNIRTIKFVLEHFKIVFSTLTKDKESIGELLQKKLKNLWLFVLAISVEFKKNEISIKDKKGLDQPLKPSNFFSFLEQQRGNSETELNYPEKLIESYFTPHSEPYNFYLQVYNLITAGRSIIDKAGFTAYLDKVFSVVEGKINQAESLVSQFMLDPAWWNFSDDEFNEKLRMLLKYVESNSFIQVDAYLNASVYLLKYASFLDSTEEQVLDKLKVGLDNLLAKFEWNDYLQNQINMLIGHYDTQGSSMQKLSEYVKQKVDELEENKNQQAIENMKELFENDVLAFAKSMRSENSTFTTPDTPTLHLLDNETVKNSIPRWQPKEVLSIKDLLDSRYLKSGFADRLTEERSFLEILKLGIDSGNFNDKKISTHLVKEQLKPTVEKCLGLFDRMSSNIR